MSRKPSLKPGTLSREELLERRISDLERMVRRFPARSVQGGSDATSNIIQQTTHGLAVGNVIRHNGTSWAKSQADTAANAVVGGVVIAVLSPDVFVMATGGYVAGLSGLTAGAVHYLDAATAGALTTTAPAIAVQVLHADTTASGIVLPASVPPPMGLASYNTSYDTLTSSSGTYSFPAYGDGDIYQIFGVGAGGGADLTEEVGTTLRYAAATSGGAVTVAIKDVSWGGGGGGGGAFMAYVKPKRASVTSFTYTVGAGGSDGSPATNGGDTTITINGATLTAYGGKRGYPPEGGASTRAGIGGTGGGALPVIGNACIFDYMASNGGRGGDGHRSTVIAASSTPRQGGRGMPAFTLGDVGTSKGLGSGGYTGSGSGPAQPGVIYVMRLSI